MRCILFSKGFSLSFNPDDPNFWTMSATDVMIMQRYAIRLLHSGYWKFWKLSRIRSNMDSWEVHFETVGAFEAFDMNWGDQCNLLTKRKLLKEMSWFHRQLSELWISPSDPVEFVTHLKSPTALWSQLCPSLILRLSTSLICDSNLHFFSIDFFSKMRIRIRVNNYSTVRTKFVSLESVKSWVFFSSIFWLPHTCGMWYDESWNRLGWVY